ncbi:conserved hypothetical protein [Neospora caninum Liverpool]|uniref:Uncharacterized protein n=1 Tax=Neospora caninum (strain Liverpool) TaxID=572307 RepID=F0VGT4_NEOCL|nr:conserved hypothetical protein [Neospora caninum Liverpool]CBZ52928.1 conserved hypothetical protein [Neospora caninum Liverpool]CEL66910.1 TPA: hypothetical protein BN1204_027160 [Neospora caninum Liverpool]|eukprot:XP_003882960.1 conserved hypothetical protein [Neospora caninum Liverpool]
MAEQTEWARTAEESTLEKEHSLETLKTADMEAPSLQYAGTHVIKKTVKSPPEVIEEMRTWLKTGVAPDGTRMMTEEAWQWHQDYYQCTVRSDTHHECLPEGAGVDFYYWHAPYVAHIGDMNLVMMHSQVNLPDGTHLPSDRLRAETAQSKRLRQLAEKRTELEARRRDEFVRQAMDPHAHMGDQYRKEGLYTKLFYRGQAQEQKEEEHPELKWASTVQLEARAAEAEMAKAAQEEAPAVEETRAIDNEQA